MKAGIVLIVIAGLFFPAHLGVGEQLSPTAVTHPTLDFIEAALRYQESASLEVTYESSTSAVTRTITYIRTPEAQLRTTDYAGEDPVTVRASFDIANSEYRIHQTIKNSGKNSGLIGRSRLGPFTQQDLMETARYPLYTVKNETLTLREWIQFGILSDTRELIDGHLCWRIDIPSPIPYMSNWTVWLDPEIGYCPRRIAFERENDGPVRTDFRDYVSIADGIWYPREMSVVVNMEGGTKSTTTDYRVLELRTRESIPKEDLLVKFPSGTVLSVAGTSATSVKP